MAQSEYPKHVMEWLEEIEKTLHTDLEKCLEYVTLLENYAQGFRSDYLMGLSRYYRGFLNLSADLSISLNYFSLALNSLIAGENWYLAIKAYVAMGNIFDYQGDVSLAIECYLKGLAMSQEHNLPVMEHNLFCNIGSVYSGMNDPANAEKMFRECERIRENGADVNPAFTTVVEANLALCSARMGEYDRAEKRLGTLKAMIGNNDQTASDMDQISLTFLETILCNANGDFEKRDAAIERLNNMELDSMSVYDAINEFYQHALLLLKIGKVEEFCVLVERMEKLVTTPSAEKKTLELWLAYYELIGEQNGYAEKTARYYKISCALEEERKKTVSNNITTRMRLEAEERRRKEVEKTNLLLKQKSERDALTGMNNRYKLNELAEAAFETAYRNGTPLAFEILDIDCYKEYNDNYGHQAGDECLISITNAIRSLEVNGGIHTARYGGDEFVIIYENYSKQEVEKMAQQLREKIRDINIEHKYSKVGDRVTISQGLFHKIPTSDNKPWDFLYGADMTLYGVKYRGKNNLYVTSSLDEALTYSNVDK